ncbi:ribonuclease Y [Seleniivibrio sp.]|uniref:ribonuclease Y n=1 Tax=Seleniivibrio sp. TaxID=2898801 RepID=UPI0025E5A4E8|nr:ribonuclease Y [Seleniivibrio sp.]MCD8553840.1 ribonuclease Y [Seleniivibrio sp.]
MGISYYLLVVAGAVIGAFFGMFWQKKRNDAENLKLNKTAEDIISRAKREGDDIVKESKLEAKDIVNKGKAEIEREVREKRNDLKVQEKRIFQKEEAVDKKMETLEKKEESFVQKDAEYDRRLKEIDATKERINEMKQNIIFETEKIANMTSEEAKQMLIAQMVDDAKLEAARTLRELEEETKTEADKKARSIISTAIQRCAPEYISEITVTVVALPSDEMKGRIIGREGRNIRTFESVTGVDIIVDDTPEAVILSSYDPFRREIAKMTLERLVSDGRIHPARIEEIYNKAKEELEKHVLEVGEEALFNLGLHNVSKDITRLLGRLKYRTSYGQNVLGHSIEVAKITGLMAAELGLNEKIAKRAGLLHDIGKAIDYEAEGSHTEIGVEVAKKHKEDWRVINAIASHHGEEEFKCIEAVLVQSADAISASRPGARREVLESYIKRLENLETIAGGFDGVSKSYAIQAGREVRIIVEPEKVNDERLITLSKDISKQIEDELTYPGQIKVTVIRESRAVGYAK